MQKTLLVTGAAGFIGSHFVDLALDKGYKVIAYDKLVYPGKREYVNPRAKFYEGDICDYGLIKNIVHDEPIHAIINFAAESSVDKSNDNQYPFIQSNIIGVYTLLDVIKNFAKNTRFVQVSTDEVNGSLTLDEPGFTEKSPINPRNVYSATKASAEHLVNSYHGVFGLNTIITRCCNNYGPRQDNTKLIPRVIEKALNGEDIQVYGSGQQIRDWIEVGDHCKGILTAFEKGKAGETYSFGANQELTNIDIIAKILDLTDSSSALKFVQDRPNHDQRYAINPTKAQTELDWKAKVGIEDGLIRLVQWKKEHLT